MSLADENWTETTVWAMHAAFLQAERHKCEQVVLWYNWQMELIDAPNLENATDNLRRMKVLYITGGRRFLLGEVPPDTQWCRVEMLRDAHLGELRIIGRCGWDNEGDRNELEQVAARRPKELQTPPAEWGPLILWGHDRVGPFTILKGNNRLTAYVSSGQTGLELPAIIGLSRHPCVWNLEDENVIVLLHHLWKKDR